MKLLDWTRRVIADVGEQEPVPIHLERTADGHGYLLRLGVRAGFGGQETARIPVAQRINPAPHPILKEIHFCEVAGQTLEAANVYALKEKVARLLESIAPARALPLCYFRVPAMDYEVAVYEEGGEIISPVVGGPRLKAPDLAGIRQRVCRYLLSAGYIEDAADVEVRVLRPRDLRAVPPAAVFRSLADSELWIPSVEGTSPDGPVVGTLGYSPRIRRGAGRIVRPGPAAPEAAPAAPDVLSLLRFLRVELARNHEPGIPNTLFAAEVRPEIWSAAEERTEDSGCYLAAPLSDEEATTLELDVRRTGAGDMAVALEDRGITLFLAPDEDLLATHVGRYLGEAGFLRFTEAVEVHRRGAPRPERLEADSIWTFGGGDEVVAAAQGNGDRSGESQKEVHGTWS